MSSPSTDVGREELIKAFVKHSAKIPTEVIARILDDHVDVKYFETVPNIVCLEMDNVDRLACSKFIIRDWSTGKVNYKVVKKGKYQLDHPISKISDVIMYDAETVVTVVGHYEEARRRITYRVYVLHLRLGKANEILNQPHIDSLIGIHVVRGVLVVSTGDGAYFYRILRDDAGARIRRLGVVRPEGSFWRAEVCAPWVHYIDRVGTGEQDATFKDVVLEIRLWTESEVANSPHEPPRRVMDSASVEGAAVIPAESPGTIVKLEGFSEPSVSWVDTVYLTDPTNSPLSRFAQGRDYNEMTLTQSVDLRYCVDKDGRGPWPQGGEIQFVVRGFAGGRRVLTYSEDLYGLDSVRMAPFTERNPLHKKLVDRLLQVWSLERGVAGLVVDYC